jgi:hypothetical protein
MHDAPRAILSAVSVGIQELEHLQTEIEAYVEGESHG